MWRPLANHIFFMKLRPNISPLCFLAFFLLSGIFGNFFPTKFSLFRAFTAWIWHILQVVPEDKAVVVSLGVRYVAIDDVRAFCLPVVQAWHPSVINDAVHLETPFYGEPVPTELDRHPAFLAFWKQGHPGWGSRECLSLSCDLSHSSEKHQSWNSRKYLTLSCDLSH